ncbi:hypothetical protein AMELA_G00096590 [Ameiurus melas]|uniref:Uncharacterized protein n=1 Tax=Ameiurus melas TaxID=219545 RepID=A0A7J6AS01_AMEME|nr:hypothetical protein AMELA_G00096590 [Ameiurus melas]
MPSPCQPGAASSRGRGRSQAALGAVLDSYEGTLQRSQILLSATQTVGRNITAAGEGASGGRGARDAEEGVQRLNSTLMLHRFLIKNP